MNLLRTFRQWWYTNNRKLHNKFEITTKRAITWNEKLHVIIFLLLVALLALAFIQWPINSTTRDIKGQISNSMAFSFFFIFIDIGYFSNIILQFHYDFFFLARSLLKSAFGRRALLRDIVNKIKEKQTTATTTTHILLFSTQRKISINLCWLICEYIILWKNGLSWQWYKYIVKYSFVLLYCDISYEMTILHIYFLMGSNKELALTTLFLFVILQLFVLELFVLLLFILFYFLFQRFYGLANLSYFDGN